MMFFYYCMNVAMPTWDSMLPPQRPERVVDSASGQRERIRKKAWRFKKISQTPAKRANALNHVFVGEHIEH